MYSNWISGDKNVARESRGASGADAFRPIRPRVFGSGPENRVVITYLTNSWRPVWVGAGEGERLGSPASQPSSDYPSKARSSAQTRLSPRRPQEISCNMAAVSVFSPFWLLVAALCGNLSRSTSERPTLMLWRKLYRLVISEPHLSIFDVEVVIVSPGCFPPKRFFSPSPEDCSFPWRHQARDSVGWVGRLPVPTLAARSPSRRVHMSWRPRAKLWNLKLLPIGGWALPAFVWMWPFQNKTFRPMKKLCEWIILYMCVHEYIYYLKCTLEFPSHPANLQIHWKRFNLNYYTQTIVLYFCLPSWAGGINIIR